MIRYLKHHQIDKKLWNDAINSSINGMVYAQAWFLDIVSPGWEALIDEGYESVMPLPAKQKYLIPYLIQPRFTQQLGVFSKTVLPPEKIKTFMETIPAKFIWKDFNLNRQNGFVEPGRLSQRVNFELNLNKSYTEIFKGYHENTQRNLSKAKKYGIHIEKPLLPDDFLEHYSMFAKVKPDAITYFQLKKIIEYSLNNKLGEITLAYDSTKHLIAGAFFMVAMNRVIYLTSFSCDEGKETSAMFMVMDAMIKKLASQPLIFDFEGSMIPGIARFFEGFGATKTFYYRYRDFIFRR